MWRIGILVLLVLASSAVFVRRHHSAPVAPIVDLGSSSAANTLPKGQCTWYAFERSLEFGHRLRFGQSYGRDAKRWPALVSNVRFSRTPLRGSVMVLDGWKGNAFGHVAFVESVQGTNRWTISHANMGAGEVFAKLDGIEVRRCECTRLASGIVSFQGRRNQFRLIGFLAVRA